MSSYFSRNLLISNFSNWLVVTESVNLPESTEEKKEVEKPEADSSLITTDVVTTTTPTTTTATDEIQVTNEVEEDEDDSAAPDADLDMNEIGEMADEMISKIYSELPNGSLFIVFTGNGDLHDMRR